MALTKEQAQSHAARIIQAQDVEFSDVYEDEELEDLDQADWELVYDEINSATVKVEF